MALDFMEALQRVVQSIHTWTTNKLSCMVTGLTLMDGHLYLKNDNGIIEETATPMPLDYGDAINEINSKIAHMLYNPIQITKFTHNCGVVECGTIITSIKLSWSLNKNPTTQTLSSTDINLSRDLDLSARDIILNDISLSNKTKFTLNVFDVGDDGSSNAKQDVYLTFAHGVYYGVVNADTVIDPETMLQLYNDKKLTRKLQNALDASFTVSPGENEYILYAAPSSYGTPLFTNGKADGGFNLHFKEMKFKNSSELIEPYDVWLSDYTGLGETSIGVTKRT